MKQELKYWIRKWDLDDNLIYKKAGQEQASFVRSQICGNLLHTHGFAVSTHYSKSCKLPVYFLKLRNGIKLIMRCNFYDWKVSVEIPSIYEPLPKDFLPTDCLSHRMVENKGERIAPCYMEGFRKEWCYDAYIPEHPSKKFSIEIPDSYRLYVIIHRLKHAYPDVAFDLSTDHRTMEQIKESIDKILADNGFLDMRDEERWDKTVKRSVMSAWGIIWWTYQKMKKMNVKEMPTASEDSQEYAKVIMRFPEVHEEFLREEWMYNDKIG